MSLLSYIIPQRLFKTTSQFNSDIRVIEEFGKPKLLVNGSRQSGGYIEWLWKKAFGAFKLGSYQSILVLGVGGGTVLALLHKRFPNASITAVDIDPKMIEIGKTFFGLGTISNLTLVVDDAQRFVQKKMNFDLIIIDLFTGRHIPDFVLSKTFLGRLAKSVVIINYLRELEYLDKSDRLENTLKEIFGSVLDYPIARNRFFLALS